MTINQLFKNKPPISLINELVKGFGLEDINDNKVFSRKDIELLNILEFMENMGKKLDDYYLPCKKKNIFF